MVVWLGGEDLYLTLIFSCDTVQEYISRMLNDGQQYWIGLVERDTEGKWSWVDGTDFKTSAK